MKKARLYHYVYITTNLLTGKQYVGDRTCACDIKDDRYLGSGKLFKQSKKIYGPKNFKKEILNECVSRKDAFALQQKYILQYNTLTPNGYNISPTGGLTISGCHSEETKKLIGSLRRGKKMSDSAKNKISVANKGHFVTEKTRKNLSNSLKGKKFTEEHRSNISKSRIEKQTSKGKNNGMFGKKHTNEAKEKNRLSHLGKHVNGAKSGATRLGKKRGKYKIKNLI